MLQLRVKAKRLNKRKVIPSFLPDPNNIVGVVNENFTFEGEEITDVTNKALGSWYKDRDGYFYWGGGVDLPIVSFEKTADKLVNLPTLPINYASQFQNFGSNGGGIKVGILDNGFFSHDAFRNKVKVIKDFTFSAGIGEDLHGHGTHVAGIIGARLKDTAIPVVGVCPDCELIIGKVIPDKSGPNDIDFILNGIDWAISQGVKVLNLSIAVSESTVATLKPAIMRAADANIIIIAPAGDVKELDNNTVQYPASQFDCCISVAEVSNTYLNSNPKINSNINFLSGYSHYMSTSIPMHDFYEPMRGSSMATAFLSGLATRFISQEKINGRNIDSIKRDEIITELKKICVPKTSLNFFDFSDFKIAAV